MLKIMTIVFGCAAAIACVLSVIGAFNIVQGMKNEDSEKTSKAISVLVRSVTVCIFSGLGFVVSWLISL